MFLARRGRYNRVYFSQVTKLICVISTHKTGTGRADNSAAKPTTAANTQCEISRILLKRRRRVQCTTAIGFICHTAMTLKTITAAWHKFSIKINPIVHLLFRAFLSESAGDARIPEQWPTHTRAHARARPCNLSTLSFGFGRCFVTHFFCSRTRISLRAREA